MIRQENFCENAIYFLNQRKKWADWGNLNPACPYPGLL
jgi:hypothetical protein